MSMVASEQRTGGYVGASLRRVEDARLVQGAGRYVDDIVLPGMLHLAFLRAQYPHARLRSLDVTPARSAPGVAAIYTAADLSGLGSLSATTMPGLEPLAHPLMPGDRVRAIGEPIAMVLAESRVQAEDAVRLIEVDYEPLSSVSGIEAAMEGSAACLYESCPDNVVLRREQRGGDPEQAFQRAPYVASLRIEHQRVAPVCLEPRGAVATYDPLTDEVTMWASTQAPFGVRTLVAASLGMPETRVRVIAPDVGGGFGAKGSAYREDVLVAFAARTLARPVKWVSTRIEDLMTTLHARDQVNLVEVAFEDDGMITALRVRTLLNFGAHLYTHTPVPSTRLLFYSTGAYRIPNLLSEVVGVVTNTAPTGPYRGAGRPEAAFLIERAIDEVARALGMDRVEVRRRNFIRPDEFPYRVAGGVVYDSGDYAKALDRALELAAYPRLVEEVQRRRGRGELVGLGIATYAEVSGGGWESGTVRVERGGKVTAITGSSPHGQGHETTFAQVVADALQVPFEDVVIRHGDTAVGAPGVGTFGSRSTPLGASALARAAGQILDRARRIAAQALEVDPSDVELRDGRFSPAGVPERGLSWAQVAARAYGGVGLPPGTGPGLEETCYFQAERDTIPFGAYIALVSIERDTGQVRVERLVAVDDCGNVINPMVVEGQLVGGIAQGVGEALLEQVVYDADGQLLSSSLLDYAVPVAESMPELVVDRTVTPTPLNPLGAKGVGEAGTVGSPPAIANAVADALGPERFRRLTLPFTAEKIWLAIQAVE